jgi:tetratricopeptide (TPR) repeat protein
METPSVSGLQVFRNEKVMRHSFFVQAFWSLCFARQVSTASMVAAVLSLAFASNSHGAQAIVEKSGTGQTVTDEEATEYGKAMEKALNSGNFAKANELVAWDEITTKATQIPNLPELKPARELFSKGILRILPKQFFENINNEIKKGGSYMYLRAELNDKEPFAQFRFKLTDSGGLNYHRLYLVRRPDGKIVASDIFVLVTGERLSETLARAWLPLATKTVRDKEKTKKASSTLDEELSIMQKILTLNQQQKFNEMLDVYKKAPESVRRNKSILVICLTAARNVSDEEYAELIEGFRKFHPNNPSLDFILIDGYILKKNYDQALVSVDRTIKQLGEDGALLGMRANCLTLMNKFPAALTEVRKAIKVEPTYPDSYSNGANIALAAKDHPATLEFLTAMEQKLGVTFNDLSKTPGFEDFVKSPQYKTWLAAHK